MFDALPQIGLALALGIALGARWGWVQGRKGAAYRAASRMRELRRELRETSTARAKIQDRLDIISDNISDALLIIDESTFTIREANARAREWFELTPQPRVSLMAAIRSTQLREAIDDAQRGNAEWQPVRIREQLFSVKVIVVDEDRLLLVLHDQTLLERLERARRDMVANVSHDLRTPLTSLQLLLESLESTKGKRNQQRALVQQLRTQIDAIADMARGLIEINRLESGRALFRLAAEPIGEMVDEAAAELAALFEGRKVRIVNDVPKDLCALADRRHVVRMISNLLENARRHAPPGSTVRITAAREADEIVTLIDDEGPGISPRERERVFERFYRADRSRAGDGSGLGLAIAKHVVEGHGGRIWASEAPGGGARLSFTLLASESDSKS